MTGKIVGALIGLLLLRNGWGLLIGLILTAAEVETEYAYVTYGDYEPNRRLEAVQPPEFSVGLAADQESRTTRKSRSRSFSDWTDG